MPEFSCRLDARPVRLVHHWEHCLGSGHATLALRADWQAQLARCRRELGVRHVRFHGILDDDVGTCVVEQQEKVYGFFNPDAIMDFLGGIGMAPLVELSFMPKGLASGGTTVFKYQGNVTPPKDPREWSELIGKLVGHWHRRYGRDALLHWLFEVWNEPNMDSFWTGGRERYFELYRRTADAIKAVSRELRVGGPATAKCEWLPEFLDFCRVGGAPLDFVSTHSYPTDALGSTASDTVSQLAGSSRHAMREVAAKARDATFGRPLYLTEWSITSNPRDPMHDQPIAAAYLVKSVLEMTGLVDGTSWWTFSDIFEENYFPYRPFHGGFGLLSIHGIPKPAYRAMQLLHGVGDQLLPMRGEDPQIDCWAILGGDRLDVVAANLVLPRHDGATASVTVRIETAPRPRRVFLRRIDEDRANPRREWIEMGQPDSLDERQLARLQAASAVRDEEVAWEWRDGVIELKLNVPVNGVAVVTCEFAPDDAPVRETAETGQYGDANADEDRMLGVLEHESWTYYEFQTDPDTGLVRDRSDPESPASIAATGLALACAPTAVERGYISRTAAAELARGAIRFFLHAPQGPQQDATGYHGFYYHFLDPASGRRTWDCELSTIDTALLIGGALMAARYFDRDQAVEREIRRGAEELYARVDWRWALNGGDTLSHGWDPVKGFIPHRWEGYSEAMLLYLLALGSPRQPLGPEHWRAWTRSYAWKTAYAIDYLYAGPLFIHQLSHCWIDFRGIADEAMRERRCEYFENSRRATLVQQRYAIENPKQFRGYSADCWGVTACEGPGPAHFEVDGIQRDFLAYAARGAPFGPDDGTLAPWAVVASLPFAPEVVLPTIHRFNHLRLRERAPHGFKTTFNATFPGDAPGEPWVSRWHYGLNQGPIVLMIENHRSGLPWTLMKGCAPLVEGLRRAGFTGGWLDRG